MLPENKDKRISTLSILSTLHKEGGDIKKEIKEAMEATEELFKAYPYEDSDLAKPIKKVEYEPLKDKDGNEIPF